MFRGSRVPTTPALWLKNNREDIFFVSVIIYYHNRYNPSALPTTWAHTAPSSVFPKPLSHRHHRSHWCSHVVHHLIINLLHLIYFYHLFIQVNCAPSSSRGEMPFLPSCLWAFRPKLSGSDIYWPSLSPHLERVPHTYLQ